MECEMMKVPLPRDAEGREIPLDTKVLYDQDGNPQDVARFTYSPRNMFLDKRWEVVFIAAFDRFASEMFLNPPEPPDSWEDLEEDLERARNKITPECWYACPDHIACKHCRFGKTLGGCTRKMVADILSRIRKLRGEQDA